MKGKSIFKINKYGYFIIVSTLEMFTRTSQKEREKLGFNSLHLSDRVKTVIVAHYGSYFVLQRQCGVHGPLGQQT